VQNFADPIARGLSLKELRGESPGPLRKLQGGIANGRFWAEAKLCHVDRMAQDQPTDLMPLWEGYALNSEDLQIRKATLHDFANVQRCAQAAYSKYIDRIGTAPAPMNADFAAQIEQGIVHVALFGLQFVGYVVFYPEGDHVHLESVAVSPEQTGKGIGKALLGYVERTARLNGLKAVELYTNEAMVENLALYVKMGYREFQRKQHAGFKRVFLRKSL
jgi:ribosomal protein S18 acetylase RimI-like enzyme